MTRPLPPPLPRWAISLLAVLAAAGLGWLLAPWVGAESAYLLFTVAAMISARYGGLWSGLAATALGGSITRALLAGFQLQLAKPVRPAELVATVASLAGRTRKLAEPQEARA